MTIREKAIAYTGGLENIVDLDNNYHCCNCDGYDDYALAYNYENQEHERIYYTKNDETDEVSIDKKITVYFMDLTEEEYINWMVSIFNKIDNVLKDNGVIIFNINYSYLGRTKYENTYNSEY